MTRMEYACVKKNVSDYCIGKQKYLFEFNIFDRTYGDTNCTPYNCLVMINFLVSIVALSILSLRWLPKVQNYYKMSNEMEVEIPLDLFISW